MNEYDFKNLNPNEFEVLSNDLLSKDFSVQIERFKPGRDLGVDGRFFTPSNESVIIQCKHYASSGFKSLLRDLVYNEYPKIKKINPSRYIVFTSVPLSPQDKDEITKSLNPYIISTSDIYGKDELNALLRAHPDIEKSHYKLWIMSSTVLHRFLNSATYNTSAFIIKEALEKNKYYAITDSHKDANDKLNAHNVLVVTGDPGVGKTTLAEQLCLEYVAKEHEFICIKDNIDEGFAVVNSPDKQIFYFDDFLGRNYIETLRFNEDARIMQFIRLIGSSRNKKFILTSRTNILDQGYLIGQSFVHDKLSQKEFILDVSQYSYEDKAKILYNFLWKSNLGRNYIEAIVNDKKYQYIIIHRNFNPRLIEFITDDSYVSSGSEEEYIKHIKESLDNPKNIWNHPYSVQLDDLSRTAVDLVVFGSGRVNEDDLRMAHNTYSNEGQGAKSHILKDFDSTMEVLIRSFIKRIFGTIYETVDGKVVERKGVYYQPFNPSISDFVLSKHIDNYEYVAKLILLYRGEDGLRFLETLKGTKPDNVNKIAEIIFDTLGQDLEQKELMYKIRLFWLLNDESFDVRCPNYGLEQMLEFAYKIGSVNEFLLELSQKIISLRSISDELLTKFYLHILDFSFLYSEVELVSSMLQAYIPQESEDVISEKFYSKLLDSYAEEMLEDFVKENVESFATQNFYDCGEGDYDVEYSINENKLADMISESTNDLFLSINADDAMGLIHQLDLEEIAAEYFRPEDEDRGGGYSGSSPGSGVDSMFAGLVQAKFC